MKKTHSYSPYYTDSMMVMRTRMTSTVNSNMSSMVVTVLFDYDSAPVDVVVVVPVVWPTECF